MAGSYGHIDVERNGELSLIENMGDAYECIEELYYLVKALGTPEQIKEALEEFYRFKRGEVSPDLADRFAHESESVPSAWACANAYKLSQRLMDTL